MGDRHVSNQFMISGPDQHANNHSPVEQPYIPIARTVATDNGPFISPIDHMSRTGIHPNSHWDLRNNSNNHRFSRPPFDPYSHSSTNQNTSLPPPGPVEHIHPDHRYNIPSTGGSTPGNLVGPYKKKIEGSSNNLYSAGSSSSSQMLTEKPTVDHHHNVNQYRGSNLSIDGQDSMRNVRSRSRSELEPCMPRTQSTHVQNYASHYYQPTVQSAYYSVPVQPVNLNADVASREWNSVPYAGLTHGWTPPPDINGLRRESSQFYTGGSSVDIDSCQREQFFRRNHVPHRQRSTALYINGPIYSNYSHGSSTSTNEQQFPPHNFDNSRFSRTTGWDRRPRKTVDVTDSHDGFRHEASFYHDSRNLLDQYQDMRLDIDDLSYEELLALEESIGNVNTGLSEDGMSKCLREKINYSVDQNHEESTCPICLVS